VVDSGTVAEFVLIFGFIAGLELVDRTNFALIGLAAREPPAQVWVGATAAFIVTTILSVAIGSALLAVLGGQILYLRLGGGILLLGYAGYLALSHGTDRAFRTSRTATITAFLLILLLEIGDTTMIFTMNFVFATADPLLVGVAAGLGLVAVATSACLLGPRIGARIEPKNLEKFVIVLLAGVGVLTVIYALSPSSFPAL